MRITIFLVKIEITVLQTILFEFENKMHLFGISAKEPHCKTHRRGASSAAPSTHRKCRAAARQQEYSRLRSRRKKKRKEKSAFSAALDAQRHCEIGQWREV